MAILANNLALPLTSLIVNQPSASTLALELSRRINPENSEQYLGVTGIENEPFGFGEVYNLNRFISPVSDNFGVVGDSRIRKALLPGFVDETCLTLPLSIGIDTSPLSGDLPLLISRKHGQFIDRPLVNPTNRRYVYPKTFQSAVVSENNNTSLYYQYVKDASFDSLAIGQAEIVNGHNVLQVAGIPSDLEFGFPSVDNKNQEIYPDFIYSLEYGEATIYNLKQYVEQVNNNDQSLYGEPSLIGGVTYLEPVGEDVSMFGDTVAFNTMGEQCVEAEGIEKPFMPEPMLSPAILHAEGFYHSAFGMTGVRTPTVFILGIDAANYGDATIWFHTRVINPSNIISYDSGYPLVFDPTQFLFPASFVQSAVFGDTAVKSRSLFIYVPAINDEAFSEYATLTNSDRYYQPKGINSQVFGSSGIANKTPSIFVDSIEPKHISSPVISYQNRVIAPTGFDRLLLGEPLLINTPEINPKSIISADIGLPIIWFKNRVVEYYGHDSLNTGQARLWFRYRSISPDSWVSENISSPIVTHGVRELISSGSTDSSYGNHWISYGAREIAPTSIYRDATSNHLVGQHQQINTDGFIATLFGERIIPVGTNIYPLGLDTEWGLADVGLYTRYVGPRGYNSFGELAGDRWGHNKIYNAVQYIDQYYQGDSGLVPPKWSDWQSIENRNKVIGAVGSISQKFGYSQIDTGARLLSPSGITPPPASRYDVSLIAYSIRAIPLEGIDSLVMESWGVVYNAARVIAPTGEVQTLTGSDADVISNRRNYRNVGRIDSLEAGTPAIGYRIRGIDIEPRYSIEPPQIELPTVFLYTRYIELVGLDSEKHGLPDLSIHFNNIAPSWSHSNRFGYPVLHNVTPTLYLNGHDSSDFGVTAIRTQWRELLAQGSNTALVGLLKIADTKQDIEVSGLQAGAVSQKPTVVKLGTNPYVTQNIWHNNESDEGDSDGFGSDELAFGKPGINQNVLEPSSIINPAPFGSISVRTNTISVDGGYFGNSISDKLSIFNKSNVLSVAGIDSRISVGKPRFSPHTIWAVVEAPEQAKRNHDSGGLHYVGETKTKPPGAIVGKPSIESTIRTIFPYGYDALRSGRHETAMSLQTIYPEDFRVSRFGIPSIPFSLQSIGFREGVKPKLEVGTPSVGPPPYNGPARISPKGVEAPFIGLVKIENKTRYPEMQGFDTLLMGYSRTNDTPYMWQGLRVGEFVPMAITGGVMTEFGKAWISHKIRGIETKGADSFSSNYNLSSFNDRMNIRYGEYRQPTPSKQEIVTTGISSYVSGNAAIRLNQHFIRPDGNSDQFRKGGLHA